MNVSVCIATRGDVDLDQIYKSLPDEWEVVVWDNSGEQTRGWPEVRAYRVEPDGWIELEPTLCENLGPHGRFAAIEYASHDLIYCQDDDVIVSDPQAIVDAWVDRRESYGRNIPYLDENPDEDPLTPEEREFLSANVQIGHVVCNMPQEFRVHYPDSAMVGFGAAFHRDLPERAFSRFFAHHASMTRDDPLFLRESCRVFTGLTPCVLVDVAKTDLPYASDPSRLWKQPDHVACRERMLDLVRQVP